MEKNILLFTNPRPFLSFFFVLELVYAFEEPLTQIINISGRDDDTNTHFGTLDGKRRVRLKRLDALDADRVRGLRSWIYALLGD